MKLKDVITLWTALCASYFCFAFAASAELPDFKELIRKVSPAVVNITVEGGSVEQETPEQQKDPMAPFRSSGSGFVISEDGYIVTCNHVIEKSNEVTVRLLNERRGISAKVIGRDKKSDIALLKITPVKPLQVLPFGDSDKVEVGEWALAIGNQFELGQSVTAGIISAKSRRVPARNSGPYDSYIQTDASINPGSSGGPLVNIQGEVIGVNTAIFSPGRTALLGTGFNIGIGFANPMNVVRDIVQQLKTQGKVTRAMLGVIIQKIDEDMADALGVKDPDGALVAEIIPDSPASKAGFQQRDIITSFDGKPIIDYEELPKMVAETSIGKEVPVDVLRAGTKTTLKVVVTELKETSEAPSIAPEKPDEIGLKIDIIPEEIRLALKLDSKAGVMVTFVEQMSPAAMAGIVPGDLITEMNGTKVQDVASYRKVVANLPHGKSILILVKKKDGMRYLALKRK